MRAEDRRTQILDVTQQIASREGFHAATLKRVATESGVSRTVIYQQFGDLAGLFVALIDRETQRAAEHFADVLAAALRTPAPQLSLGGIFMGVLHAVDAHPETWRLFLFPPEGAPPELHQRMLASEERVRAQLASALLGIDPAMPDPEYSARVLQAAGRELLQLRLSDPTNATDDRLLALAERLDHAVRSSSRVPTYEKAPTD